MQLTFTKFDNHPLITGIIQMSIDDENTPYSSPLLTKDGTFIVLSITKEPNIFEIEKQEFKIDSFCISGHIYGALEGTFLEKTYDVVILFKPTAFYKIFNISMKSLMNQIFKVKEFNKELYDDLYPIYYKNRFDVFQLKKEVSDYFEAKTYNKSKKINDFDKIIALIEKRQGNIEIEEILDFSKISKRTLENNFKNIIGITPAKYIRQLKFKSLFSKYQSNENIDLEVIAKEMSYYDYSHFFKDFKLFTGKTPKQFFGKHYPFITSILNKENK